MLSIEETKQISNTLQTDYQFYYLVNYINKLNNKELENFVIWFDNLVDLNNVNYGKLIEDINKYKNFLDAINWDWSHKEESLCELHGVEDNCNKTKITKLVNNLKAVNGIAYICVICVFAYIFSVTFFSAYIDDENRRFVDQSLGNLYGILNIVIGFYCGGIYNQKINNDDTITTITTKNKK